jgi:hypothetical protein
MRTRDFFIALAAGGGAAAFGIALGRALAALFAAIAHTL